MAPLRPSADIPHVGTQKDTYGLRLPIFTIHWLMMKYIPYTFSWLLCQFCHVELYSRLSILTTRASFPSLPCSKSRILVFAGCAYTESRVIRRLLYYIPANVPLNMKT